MDKFFRIMGSLPLAITLLSLIAVFCMLGTLLPQGTQAEILKTTTPDWAKALLLATGANQMYHSAPFLALMTAFLFNLALATQEKVWPPFRMLFRPPLTYTSAALKAMPVRVPVGDVPPELVAGALRARGFKVWDTPTGPAGHKGRWSRSAPMVVHVSMFIILIGVLVGGFYGFKSQTLLEVGQFDTITHIVERAEIKGPLVPKRVDWQVHLDKFWLEHYPNGMVQQYNSELRIMQNAKLVDKKHIWVNEPMIVDGVYLYQSSWDVGSVDLLIDGQPKRVPMFPIEAGGHAGKERLLLDGVAYTLYLPAMRAPVLALDEKFQPVAPLVRGKDVTLGTHTVRYAEPVLASGLQVKGDPGIPWVLGGWTLISIGLIIVFFGYRQVWYDTKTGMLVGKANRGQVLLERELESIAERLRPAAGQPRDLSGATAS
ncbi:MAG: cytochrome c biogenesis protein ResB [Candidatus Sericytochromatia bacterium]|nr:cytochrome c biogenesis protein ResB [Candidatus Sericytochromatia bacterium]